MPFPLVICGLDELDGHRDVGATHVLSILDPGYPVPEAFGQYGEHARLELRFDDIIDEKPGSILPQPQDVTRILEFGRGVAAEPGASLLVHCHAGISRSTAAMVLVLAQALPGQTADALLAMVHDIREKAWPNLRMIEIGDAMLGRGGALVAATHRLHRLQLGVRPQLADFMTEGGRGREVQLARSA